MINKFDRGLVPKSKFIFLFQIRLPIVTLSDTINKFDRGLVPNDLIYFRHSTVKGPFVPPLTHINTGLRGLVPIMK